MDELCVANPGATSAGIQDDVLKSAALGPPRTRAKKQAYRLIDGTLIYLSGTQLLFELHVNAAASGVDSNAVLRGGNAHYHTGLI